MSGFYVDDGVWPDFSALKDTAEKIRLTMSAVADTAIKLQEIAKAIPEAIRRYQEVIRPLAQKAAEISAVINSDAFSDAMRRSATYFQTINILGKKQFVCWEPIPRSIAEEIIDATNANGILKKYALREKGAVLESVIAKCAENGYVKKRSRVFSQAVEAYHNKHYDLALIGILSVIDSVLSDTSKQIKNTSIFKRGAALIDKLEKNETLENDEYAVITLVMTFEATMTTLGANSDFSKKEPTGMNRHWIMHGRSGRRRTQLDCIKLFHFLYGILIVNELAEP